MVSRLQKIAQQQAAILQTRDEVIGVGLYGSLSYNQVTPFSDLDIFVITSESEHSPAIEHRLKNGIRVDFIWEPLEKWRKIRHSKPRYMPWYLVKALLLGTENTILYDPQGVIREKRDELRQETTYGEFLAPMVASALNEISEQLTIAIWQEEEGQLLNAWNELIPWATGYLFYIICDFTNRKRFEEAVQDIGIPELSEHIQEICRLKCAVNGFTPEYVNQLYEVDCAHWEYQIQHVWEPLKQHLVAQGVQSPDSLTVKGELVLPYGGERLYELGRALIEHSFSLDWGKALMEQGDILEAIDKIRYEDIITNANEKWRRIDNAITNAGYHTRAIIQDFLASREFRERTEIAKKALDPPDATPVTAQHVHQLLTAVYEYTRLLSEHWVSHYPNSLESMPELYTLSRAEIVQRCREREARIDNHAVSIIVSKERAAVKSLVFKSGTNSDLVETYWIDACLLDLSSTSHHDLRGKWKLLKEEIGSNAAHFTFSQDEGYLVNLDISWSEAGITVEYSFQLPQPIAINSNIAISGSRWPKPRDDYWAVTIDGKIETGNYDYKLGSHVFIYPSDGTYFTPEGCWIAAWNQDIDEVCGFTFSPNCGCIIARGGSTDFEFYLPVGESTVRFHVIKPKPCPPYLALQEWAYSEQPIPLAKGGAEPRSPYINHTQD